MCGAYILNVFMQGSARLYQKHIQQTAFSGYLLPLKADSQEMAQTDQCTHTYYYPTPSSCIGFVPSINMHISGGGGTWIVSGFPILGFTGCIEGHVVNVGQFHGISTNPNLVRQLLFYFSQQLMSSLNQWLLILARMRWCGKAVPLLGTTPGFSFLRLEERWNREAWTHFPPAKMGLVVI